RFIDIGTPHTGSPKAFKILGYGDDMNASFLFGLFGLNDQKLKSISQNMPAVYELLPSRSYFDNSDNDYKYYVFDGIGGGNRLNFDATKDYMKFEGRNSILVDRADEFHQEIDRLNPADYGVETYNIVGCGTPTIGQFYILAKNGNHYNYNIRMINGDGTVPLKSAQALPAIQTYYVKAAQHAILPSTSGVKELIISILTGNSFDMADYSNLTLSENECPIPDGKIVSFHSPIDLHVYDFLGNHTGPDINGDVENDIAGVMYEVVEDNKFAFLPAGQDYQITGESTGAGTFDVRIEDMIDGEVVETTLFSNIPLTETTRANFDVGTNIPNQIYLDNNGDGDFESTISVSTTTSGFLESTGLPEVASIIELPTEESQNQPLISRGGSRSTTQNIISNSTTEELATINTPSYPSTFNDNIRPLSTEGSTILVGASHEEISTSTNKNLNNTAIAYKSLPQKLKNLFKSIWRWFINRL
ncbi:MAG: hypothetical protein V1709_05960, partial [Planctomycetota bacterium]